MNYFAQGLNKHIHILTPSLIFFFLHYLKIIMLNYWSKNQSTEPSTPWVK